MSTWSKVAPAILLAGAMLAQETALDTRSSLKINFPTSSPVTLVSADLGESKATARGGAMVLDIHSGLVLRNASNRRIRGVTLLVLAQDYTPGGKGSTAVPSLDVGPGDAFPVRIDLHMLRPLAAGSGPLVEILLDGVLFDDLTFYGENRLNSRRQLTLWELEARRDRKYYQAALEAHGPDGLKQAMLAAVSRAADRPRIDVQVVRRGVMPRAENAPATNYEMDRKVQFSFLHMPGAPVELMSGAARLAGNEAKSPVVEIRNSQQRPVRHLEIGLVLRDSEGREFLAGTVPSDLQIGPGATATVSEEATLRIQNRGGGRMVLESPLAFVDHVEFADGNLWIPSRVDLDNPRLGRLVPPSPEEQRLMQIYQKRGLKALADELKK